MSADALRTLIAALAGMVLCFLVTLVAYHLPAAPNINSPGLESPLRASLNELVGDGMPHPLGSAADARLREKLVARLTGLGYHVELQTGWACNRFAICGKPTNIVALPPGTRADTLQDAVLLAAHYDSVPAGPGAGDDTSGVVIALDIAARVALTPHKHPVIVLLSDGEEAGLLGAILFVREHPLAKLVKAAVNVEARGTSGPSLMFETGASNLWLMRLYQRAVARPMTDSLFYVIYRALPNDTDFTAFKSAGYQGYNFAFIGDVAHYHTPLDNVALLDETSLQHQSHSAASALLALADAPTLEHTRSEAVFFDLGSRSLLVWSTGLNLLLALAALALLLAVTAALTRRGDMSFTQIARGALGGVCTLVVGAALSALILLAVWSIDALPLFSWIAQPFGVEVACVAAAFMAAAFGGKLMGRQATFAATWVGVALLIAALALLLALALPGASFVLLIPALSAALLALPCLWMRDTDRLIHVALPVTVWVTMWVATPIVMLVYDGLGILAFPAITLMLCLVTWQLLPLFAGRAASLWRRRGLMAAGLIGLLGMFATLSEPAYSERWPMRLNFEYRVDADERRAYYLAEPSGKHLPRRVAAAARFAPHSRPEFAGSLVRAFFAPAPFHELPPPELSVRSALREVGHVRYLLHLSSPRGAPQAFLVFPAVGAVEDFRVRGAGDEGLRTRPIATGSTILSFEGLPPGGVDFSIDATQAPFKVELFDESFELVEGGFLTAARPQDATSSQDGDVTVVQHSVTLNPAAGR